MRKVGDTPIVAQCFIPTTSSPLRQMVGPKPWSPSVMLYIIRFIEIQHFECEALAQRLSLS